jgi:hypothetical protein
MPSIQDVADQINAKLDSINNNTAATAASTAQTLTVVEDIRSAANGMNGRLDAIQDVLAAGFANLAQGLFAQLEQQRVTNALLDHHRQQNDTIICELVNSNELLCGITRKLTDGLALDEALVDSTRRVEGISVRVHAEAAGDYDRALELKSSIAECCPPPPVEPEPCPPSCEKPRFQPRTPKGHKWEPLPTPDNPDQPDRPVG